MAMLRLLLAASLGATARAVDLTPENWDEHTSGKTVFIKFLAPWCGHCKKMKPDWDKLMKNWNKGNRSKTSLIADVDCTDEKAKPLCETHGVEGFPTIKWGDPSSLESYEGGRDYNSLKKFAKSNLKPMCSPTNVDLCDDEKKAEIAKLEAMPLADLETQIAEKKKEIEETTTAFDEGVKKLQADYEQLQKDKDETIKAVKDSGLGLMQAVQAAAKKSDGKKEEL